MLTQVLIAGRSAEAVKMLESHLHGVTGILARTRVITNGHADPLYGVTGTPDIVLLRFEANQTAELMAWAARPQDNRPPLIVVGPGGHVESTRLAIRSGAQDFLPEPVSKADLLAAIAHVQAQRRETSTADRGSVHAFVSAAGGAGSSMIAANVAHLLAAHARQRTALVDLDLNFAPISHHLNLQPQRGLLAALDEIETLDEHALAGFGAEHTSGLRLFCSTAQHAVLSKDVQPDRIGKFIDLLCAHHQQVVIDAPHAIDGLTATAFGMATSIYIVLQQSTLHVRNATRAIRILRDELAVPAQRIRLIVNRFDKNSPLRLEDIKRTLGTDVYATLPSDYQSAQESSDAGLPLYEVDKSSAISRSLLQIVERISGMKADRPGLLQRALPSFLRNNP